MTRDPQVLTIPRGAENIRNGTCAKTVLTDADGEVVVEVPRDRAGTFEPVIVKKRQRRLSDVDAVAISLFAKGLTTGEISAHFAEVYGASIGRDTISRITDAIVEEMQAWTSRPLLGVYAAVFVEAIYVKVRDGQVGNQLFYAAIGVDLNGRRDVLGLWAGRGGGESAKFWLAVLTDLKNRGVRDIFILVCDGRKGLPDAVTAVLLQLGSLHSSHHRQNTASRDYRTRSRRSSRPRSGLRDPPDPGHLPLREQEVLGPTRPGHAQDLYRGHPRGSLGRVRRTGGEVGQGTPRPIGKLWHAAWEEFTPFLAYDVEIRRVLFSTKVIESLNARYRRAVTERGHFPAEQAALKVLYFVTRGMDPKGTGQAGWAIRWKEVGPQRVRRHLHRPHANGRELLTINRPGESGDFLG